MGCGGMMRLRLPMHVHGSEAFCRGLAGCTCRCMWGLFSYLATTNLLFPRPGRPRRSSVAQRQQINIVARAVQSASLHQWLWLASLRVSELGS
jgi:hypothetical protein